MFELNEIQNQKGKTLSGGQRRRVDIARAIIHNPEFLILDEPTRGVDIGAKKEIYNVINDMAKKGVAVILVSSELPEILGMSDRIVVMKNGYIQQVGTPTEVFDMPENLFVAEFIGESNIIEGIMLKDLLVKFDDVEFECVDKGFKKKEEVEVVLRPEDINIVKPEKGKLKGHVKSIVFKGVHYEIIVETKYREYMIHTTDFYEVGLKVGLKFDPEDIHVMYKMGN